MEGNFALCSGQAPAPAPARRMPGTAIRANVDYELGNVVPGECNELSGGTVDVVWGEKLHSASHIAADVREQAEDVAARDLEVASPSRDHPLVVREQAPQEVADRCVSMPL